MPFFADSLLYLISIVGSCGSGLFSGVAAAVGRSAWNRVTNEEKRQDEIAAVHSDISKDIKKLVSLQMQANDQCHPDSIRISEEPFDSSDSVG